MPRFEWRVNVDGEQRYLYAKSHAEAISAAGRKFPDATPSVDPTPTRIVPVKLTSGRAQRAHKAAAKARVKRMRKTMHRKGISR